VLREFALGWQTLTGRKLAALDELSQLIGNGQVAGLARALKTGFGDQCFN
jgi:hypothetical protein